MSARADYYGLTDDEFNAVVQATRVADEGHKSEGGGTRHWLRDFFLPSLDTAGFQIAKKNGRSSYAHMDMPHYPGEPAPATLDPITYGILEGLGMYAWWKDGGQYVGTTGSTLRDARARVLRERGYEVTS